MLTKTPERGAFDYLLKPAVPLDPPLPPSYEGGGPQRIRVEIEIVQRPPEPRRPKLYLIILIAIFAALVWSLAR